MCWCPRIILAAKIRDSAKTRDNNNKLKMSEKTKVRRGPLAEQRLAMAVVADVCGKKMTFRECAKKHGISKGKVERVLKGAAKGRVPGQVGRPRMLSKDNETELSNTIKVATRGGGMTRRQLASVVCV